MPPEIEQEPIEAVFVNKGCLVEHLSPVVEMAVTVNDRAAASLVRNVPCGQVQAVGSRQRDVLVDQPVVRGGVLRLAARSHAAGVQGRYQVGQADEDEQKDDQNAHGRASIGYLSPAHNQGRHRPDQRTRDKGGDRPQHDMGNDQAE